MGRGNNTNGLSGSPRRFTDEVTAGDLRALRLLAIAAEDHYSGLVPDEDYGDGEFDTGLLLIDDDGRSVLGQAGEELVGAAESNGRLAENVQAFRLLLAVYDGITDDNEEAVAAGVRSIQHSAITSCEDGSVLDRGSEFVVTESQLVRRSGCEL